MFESSNKGNSSTSFKVLYKSLETNKKVIYKEVFEQSNKKVSTVIISRYYIRGKS